MRIASVHRKTNETDIQLTLNLDGSGQAMIQTGIGFYDHMLHLFALHGLFDLTIQAQGDLYIDAHHTAEDVAIALGQALDQALGNRAGIWRVGSAEVPMDEALARVVLDLSGRPYCVFRAAFSAPMLGTMPSSLVQHIFESLSVHGKLNLHAECFYGRDDHHIAEALFKALGRALDVATLLDPRRAGQVPSTKGSLTETAS
jgi:imidazoleglycerol-phosphate dehydratase